MREAEAKALFRAHMRSLDDTTREVIQWHMLHREMRTLGAALVNTDVDINDMTVATWKAMSKVERQGWTQAWRICGFVLFACLQCGFQLLLVKWVVRLVAYKYYADLLTMA